VSAATPEKPSRCLPLLVDEAALASAQRAARLMSQPGSAYTFSAYRDVAALANFVLSLDRPHDQHSSHHVPDPTGARMTNDTYVFKTSRLEIADAIGGRFTGDAKTREELVELAKEEHASTEVLLALSSLLPDKRYAGLRELWPDLPDLPVQE
jgi:hypothetical protein